MADVQLCPECDGAGIVTVVWQGLPESAADAAECPCCGGKGEITAAHAKRLERGRKMRRARVAAGVSLADAARRDGITTRERADIEWGRE